MQLGLSKWLVPPFAFPTRKACPTDARQNAALEIRSGMRSFVEVK